MGEIEIPKAPNNPYVQIDARYDYKADRSKCPSCGGLGIPWHGWFTCERCSCIAVVSDGRAFLPAVDKGVVLDG